MIPCDKSHGCLPAQDFSLSTSSNVIVDDESLASVTSGDCVFVVSSTDKTLLGGSVKVSSHLPFGMLTSCMLNWPRFSCRSASTLCHTPRLSPTPATTSISPTRSSPPSIPNLPHVFLRALLADYWSPPSSSKIATGPTITAVPNLLFRDSTHCPMPSRSSSTTPCRQRGATTWPAWRGGSVSPSSQALGGGQPSRSATMAGG